MRDLFREFLRPSADEFRDYWARGLFAVDANVLLNLYRYSPKARNELLKSLKKLDDRLWLPRQAGIEFRRNRPNVIASQQRARAKLDALITEVSRRLIDDLQKHHSNLSRREGADQLLRVARSKMEELRNDLIEVEAEYQEALEADAVGDEDPIYEELCEIFDEKVGSGFSGTELETIYAEGKDRYKKRLPPGYNDSEKPDPANRFGDLVIWKELIREGKDRHLPVIFVCDDRKDDWFWEASGERFGPRPELVAEMTREADVPFWAYTPLRFMEYAQAELGEEVSEEVLSEVREFDPSLTMLTRRTGTFPYHASLSEAGSILASGYVLNAGFPSASGFVYNSATPIDPAYLNQVAATPYFISQQSAMFGSTGRDGSQVLIMLHNRLPAGVPGSVKCTVWSPDRVGRLSAAQSDPEPRVRYPRDFEPEDSDLTSGTYRYVWSQILSDGTVRDVVQDTFEIQGSG